MLPGHAVEVRRRNKHGCSQAQGARGAKRHDEGIETGLTDREGVEPPELAAPERRLG